MIWDSDGADADHERESIQGRFVDALGTRGAQFQINAITAQSQRTPAIVRDPQGGFVVAWENHNNDVFDPGYDIVVRRLTASGRPTLVEQQVNTYTTNSQRTPEISALIDGTFVVAWGSRGSGGDDIDNYSVQARQLVRTEIFADGFESGDSTAWSTTNP